MITISVLDILPLVWKVKFPGRDSVCCFHLQSMRLENCRQGGIEEAASSTMLPVQVNQRPAQAPPQQQQQAPRPPGNDPKKREEFYANIGDAIRTLKKEIPQLFQKDLTCKSVHIMHPRTNLSAQFFKEWDMKGDGWCWRGTAGGTRAPISTSKAQ